MVEYETVCLNKWLGRCSNCKKDYDLNHHPNNLDCKNYKPTTVISFYVSKNGELDPELIETKQPELEKLVAVK